MSDIPLSGRARLRHGLGVLFLAAALGGPLGAEAPDPDLSLEPARELPPALQTRGQANPAYPAELEARFQSLPEADRRAFFRHLRRQQRALNRFLEEMVFNYEKAKALHKDLAGEDQAVTDRSADLLDAQRRSILQYRAMGQAIENLRLREDPIKLDATDLQADLYAGFEFSSVYQDQGNSFFSKSLPFVALDLRHSFRWPGQDRWLEAFGTLAFQSTSKENSDPVSVITTSSNFSGKMGAWWMHTLAENVSWGLVASTGLVGYSTQQTAADLSGSNRNQFQSSFEFGATLRQEQGPMRNSCAEVAYEKDPLFLDPNRLLVRGKVVLTQFGSSGGYGDFYMEGWASKGRVGRDEAVLLLGIRLNTLSFFRGLGGGPKL
jgi:hypothetical protein